MENKGISTKYTLHQGPTWLLVSLMLLWGTACFLVGQNFRVVEDSPANVEMPSDTLTDWTVLQMAIVMTESQFNPEAVGKNGDWGIFQITNIYSKELNRIQSEITYSHEDAFDVEKSVAMFGTMQDYYNPERDPSKALLYHNKAAWYRKRVEQNIVFIQRMESVRKVLQENQDKIYFKHDNSRP